MANTGIGAALVLSGDSTFSGRWKTISAPSFTVDALDDTPLSATSFYQKVPDDLANAPPITVTYYCDLKQDLPGSGKVPTVTLTFPKQANTTTAATLIGTAIITRVDMPELSPGQQLMGTMEIQFNGKAGPTFTKGT